MAQDGKTYTTAVIIIGNEILSGRTQDTNLAWIAEHLLQKGITISEARVISDQEDVIIKTLNELRETNDYVITTGGIGPTHDDITSACIAKAFGVKLELHPEANSILLEYYGKDELNDARLKMAMIPKGGKLINNPVTAAPGFQIENVYCLAGVPKIMQAMLDDVIQTMNTGTPVLSNTISCNLPESMVAHDLAHIQEAYPDIEIGSYPHYRKGVLGLSLVLRSTNSDTLDKATNDVAELVKKYGDTPLFADLKTANA